MRHMPWSSTGTRSSRALRLLCLMLATTFFLQVSQVQAQPVEPEPAQPATVITSVEVLDG